MNTPLKGLGSAIGTTAGCLALAAPAAHAGVCESMREQVISGKTFPKIELCMDFYNLADLKIREVKFTVKPLTGKGLGGGLVYFIARGSNGSDPMKIWNAPEAQGIVRLPGTTAWACTSYVDRLALKAPTPCGRYESPASPGAPQHTSVSFVGLRIDDRTGQTIDSLTSSGFNVK